MISDRIKFSRGISAGSGTVHSAQIQHTSSQVRKYRHNFVRQTRRLVLASSDHTARLWEMASGETVRQYNGHHKGEKHSVILTSLPAGLKFVCQLLYVVRYMTGLVEFFMLSDVIMQILPAMQTQSPILSSSPVVVNPCKLCLRDLLISLNPTSNDNTVRHNTNVNLCKQYRLCVRPLNALSGVADQSVWRSV